MSGTTSLQATEETAAGLAVLQNMVVKQNLQRNKKHSKENKTNKTKLKFTLSNHHIGLISKLNYNPKIDQQNINQVRFIATKNIM